MGCLISARYSNTAEVYDQTQIQGDSGALKRVWDYNTPSSTIDCVVQPILVQGMRGIGSGENWTREFLDIEWVHVLCSELLSKRQRLGHLKDKNGVEIYPNIVFEIIGITPVPDAFGAISEYQMLCSVAQEK